MLTFNIYGKRRPLATITAAIKRHSKETIESFMAAIYGARHAGIELADKGRVDSACVITTSGNCHTFNFNRLCDLADCLRGKELRDYLKQEEA